MREIRVRQGLKQAEVARRMGLDPSMTSLWERGKRLVPRSRVPALAAALGVSVDELRGQAPVAPTGQ
jgi:transcriptional regulator with XRE-family HTH domain